MKKSVRLCDKCLPKHTFATGPRFQVRIGNVKLAYDLCKPHRDEMQTALTAAIAAKRAAKRKVAKRSKTKKAAPKKTSAKPAKKKSKTVRKIVTLACRYGCGEVFKGRSAGYERGQHEFREHGGAFKEPKAA